MRLAFQNLIFKETYAGKRHSLNWNLNWMNLRFIFFVGALICFFRLFFDLLSILKPFFVPPQAVFLQVVCLRIKKSQPRKFKGKGPNLSILLCHHCWGPQSLVGGCRVGQIMPMHIFSPSSILILISHLLPFHVSINFKI